MTRGAARLEYGVDAEKLELRSTAKRVGCYAYTIGLAWQTHLNIGRNVARCELAEWFVWHTITETDPTRKQVTRRRWDRRKPENGTTAAQER